MNDLQARQDNTIITVQDMTLENRLEIIEEGIRRKYLTRLTEMEIANVKDIYGFIDPENLEDDLIYCPLSKSIISQLSIFL